MKKLSNLKGAKALNKQEQQSINGGDISCWSTGCPIGFCCGYYHSATGYHPNSCGDKSDRAVTCM